MPAGRSHSAQEPGNRSATLLCCAVLLMCQHADWQVIRTALSVQLCSAEDVGVLEMHGTGTGLGDPIEVGAAFAVFRTTAAGTQPLELQASVSHAAIALHVAVAESERRS